MDDSKKLSAAQREAAREAIERAALAIGVGIVGPETIDRINILQATLLAARKALQALGFPVHLLMTDYLWVDSGGIPVRAEPKADERSLSVAAASIIAKTARDRLMRDYAEEYPGYALERNKGYGSEEHLDGLARLGPTSLHRHSFAGVGLFDSNWRPSLSFDRLRAARGSSGAEAFRLEALSLLKRRRAPLVDRERREVRLWLEAAP